MTIIDVMSLTFAAAEMGTIAHQYPRRLGDQFELLRDANNMADSSPEWGAELIQRFLESFRYAQDIEGMSRIIRLVEKAIAPPLPPVLEKPVTLYSNSCSLADLQQLAIEVGDKAKLPPELRRRDHLSTKSLYLWENAAPLQFMIEVLTNRSESSKKFRLHPIASMKNSLKNSWRRRDSGWCSFFGELGFVWQWLNGSILLAKQFFPDEIELVFYPVIGDDGWHATGDWLQDNYVVRNHREFFIHRTKRWEPTTEIERGELSKQFGSGWVDLVNPDFLRAFHRGCIQAQEDQREQKPL